MSIPSAVIWDLKFHFIFLLSEFENMYYYKLLEFSSYFPFFLGGGAAGGGEQDFFV